MTVTRPRREDGQPSLLVVSRDAMGNRYLQRVGQRGTEAVKFSEEEWIELEQAIRRGQYF